MSCYHRVFLLLVFFPASNSGVLSNQRSFLGLVQSPQSSKMADAIVSVLLNNLIDLAKDEAVLQLGFKKELGKISSTFRAVRSLLEDAERRQIKDESVKDWLLKLEEAAYEMDDVLEEWMVKSHRTLHPAAGRGRRVRNSLLSPISYIKLINLRRKYGSKLCVMREKLDHVAKEKDQFQFQEIKMIERAVRSTYSFVDKESVKGRDGDREILVTRLRDDNLGGDQPVSVISIVGMGGVGKTTLAQYVYDDQRVKDHFPPPSPPPLWVCVSDDFNVSEIMRKIIEDGGENCSGETELNSRAKKLVEMLGGKRFILVLDDVWNEDYSKWEQLKNVLDCGANGSKIVITTRKTKVAEIVGSHYKHPLEGLSSDECWLIFQRIALSGRTNVAEGLEKIGREIVKKCKYLPLAVKTMASMLRTESTKERWQRILSSDIWTLPQSESDVIPALLLSYIDLPSHLRRCFGYCSMYPKNWVMDKHELVRMWVAQGYVVVQDREKREMEDIGEEYFNELLGRSLFQEPQEDKYEKGNVISCKMHDLVHDVAKLVTRGECESFESSSSWSGGDNILHCRVRWDDFRQEERGDEFAKWLSGGRNLRTLVLRYGPKHLDLKIGRNARLRSIRVLSLWGNLISEDKLGALGELIHIRYLDLGQCNNIKSLPRSIKKLELLTYLNLSKTNISELPEWITDLYLLRSVDLRDCYYLAALPEGMHQLVSLRHLDTPQLIRLPAMIGRLSQLRTLPKFIVAAREEEEGRSRSSNIGELRDLNLLRGSLRIIDLENVRGRDEARVAKLEEKRSLSQLELEWSIIENRDVERDEEVLEGLCPPPGLARLEIRGYGGCRFPGWMDQVINCSRPSISTTNTSAGTTPSASIFSQLQELSLYSCFNVSQLPGGLGLLPRLKKLTIHGLKGGKKVGCWEVLGVADNHDDAVTVPAAGFFPDLEELSFDDLEAWDDRHYYSPQTSGGNDQRVAAPMMPCLRSLTLENCGNLKALPPIFTTALRKLCLFYSPWIKMKFFPPQGIERIELRGMPTRSLLMESPSLPTTLKHLTIGFDDDLTGLPVDDLLRLTSLRELTICNCRNLETLPKEMSRLQELKVLRIRECPKLADKSLDRLLWPNIRHIRIDGTITIMRKGR